MAIRFTHLSLVAALALTACSGRDSKTQELAPAAISISTDFVEFGEIAQGEDVSRTVTLSNTGQVALGIQSIQLATELDSSRGHAGSFSLAWSADDVILPEGGDTDASEARERPYADSADTGGEEPDTDQPLAEGVALVLPAGARMPLTITFSPEFPADNYDAIIVTTADETYEEGDNTSAADKVYRDTHKSWSLLYVHGEGEETAANAVVSPKNLDMGFVWAGQSETDYVAIKNVGDGPLTISSVEMEDGCSEGFAITYAPEPGTVVEGNTATVIEVVYEPTEVDDARCTLLVTTSDLDSPVQEVKITANVGKNPSNTSPVVQIHDPELGYQHQGWGPIRMEVTVRDADQPAETLNCKVRSSLQLAASLANCTPTDESGHFWVDVPIEGVLEAGLDVLTVQVTDDSGVSRKASIPVLINSAWPSNDNDGDGFAFDAEENADCDDDDINTYPYAAEIYDGQDNDCDLRADEGTDGADDDGDGMAEIAGDCDDNNDDTYRGAPEIQDGADNDCDGTTDENTSAYDDDGDGFAELDLDCDDASPLINPSVVEVCGDGRDNNCNGLKDSQEPCLADDSSPMIVGKINPAKTAIEVGESVQIAVYLYEADGDPITHAWSVKDNAGLIDDPTAPGITWTAPESLPSGAENGYIYRISYIAQDDDGNQVWDFAEIAVYPRGDLNRNIIVVSK